MRGDIADKEGRTRRQHQKNLKAILESASAGPSKIRKMESNEDVMEYHYFIAEMEERGIPEQCWSTKLQAVLSKKYQATVQSLTRDKRNQWDTLVEALTEADQEFSVQAPYKFFTTLKEKGESFQKFAKRLSKLFWRMSRDQPETPDAKRSSGNISLHPYHLTLRHMPMPETTQLSQGPVLLRPNTFPIRGGTSPTTRAVDSGTPVIGRETLDTEEATGRDSDETRKRPRRRTHHHHHQALSRPTLMESEVSLNTSLREDPKLRTALDLSGVVRWAIMHTSARQKVNINLLQHIKKLDNDVPGKVAGKPVKQVMLDTGAHTTVICSDLILPGTPTDGILIVKGLGSGWMPCPYVKVPVHAKGETVELRALVMPRTILGRDILLGRDCPVLEYNWRINAAGTRPALPPPEIVELSE